MSDENVNLTRMLLRGDVPESTSAPDPPGVEDTGGLRRAGEPAEDYFRRRYGGGEER